MSRITRIVAAMTLSTGLAAGPMLLAAPAVHADAPSVYVVKRGDSLSGIASKLKVSLASLLQTNNMTIDSLILPGQQLAVPGAGGSGGAPGSQSAGSYTVKAGDSLSGIAARHGITLAALLQANGLTTKSLILPGRVLTLPAGAVAPAAPQSGAGAGSQSGGSYTVKAGDSLGGIAARHGIRLGALLAANNMTAKSLILPGQALKLPAGAAAAPESSGSGGSGSAGGSTSTYTVKAGDSLGGIASKYGITLGALLGANGMTAKSLILPGQALKLPAGAKLSGPEAGQFAATGTAVDTVLAYALAQIGKPYQFFTKGPSTFDCSGLTLAAYATIGVKLVHQSASQALQGTAVDFWNEPIRAGDLVFMKTNGSQVINHVGLAINATTWVHAPRPGEGVKVGQIPAKSLITDVRRFVNG